jgi:hypothetical protein
LKQYYNHKYITRLLHCSFLHLYNTKLLIIFLLQKEHPDISRFMHVIHSENPPPIKSDNPIDITPSLDYIKELGDNDDMSIHDLSMKTVFLLALVTASRPSDLRRIDLFTLKVTCSLLMVECIKPKEYNIAKTHSLTTNKSASKRIYIGLYESSEYLCPYSTLTTLIKCTQT